jgi:hypothetical protein
MAITIGKPYGHIQRGWGYEVRVDYLDEELKRTHHEVFIFKGEPDSKQLEVAIAARKVVVEDRIILEAKLNVVEERLTLNEAWQKIKPMVIESITTDSVSAKETMTKAEYLAAMESSIEKIDTTKSTTSIIEGIK